MRFDWDPDKAAVNFRKHAVSFNEAQGALVDPLALSGADPDHSLYEARFVTFGVSAARRLLVVAYTERERGEVVRIISASERRKQSGGCMKKGDMRRSDELRREYKRSDFGEMVRGKYAPPLAAAVSAAAPYPGVAPALPAELGGNHALGWRTASINLTFECAQEDDGQWLADIPQLPGVTAHGATAVAAMARAQVLALRAIAERIESEQTPPVNIHMSVPPAG